MVSKDFAIIIAIIIVIVIIIIFMFIKIQKLSKNNIKENFSSDDLAKVRTEINKIYDMDVEAIRNLGHISKSLLTGTNYHSTDPGTPGVLTIPADNTKFKGNVAVDGGITMGHNQIIYTPSGNMHLHGEEVLYLLNQSGVHISNAWGGNGNLHVDGHIYMAAGQHVQSAGRLHISGPDNVVILNKHGLLVSKHDGASGNLHVEGNINIKGLGNVDGNLTVNGGRAICEYDAGEVSVWSTMNQQQKNLIDSKSCGVCTCYWTRSSDDRIWRQTMTKIGGGYYITYRWDGLDPNL